MTGESVMGFVRRLRLERAAMRLRYSADSVTEVALTTGYGTHEAFTRAFKARFGASPTVYREQGRIVLQDGLEIFVRQEPERHCVATRYTGNYDECGSSWGQLTALTQRAGLQRHALGTVSMVYDDPEVTAAEHLRYDACLVLPPERIPRELPPGLTRRMAPAGRYAIARHRGPYDHLLEVYVTLLGRYLPHRRVELFDEPVLEIYLNQPGEVPPEQLLTEVCVRIE